jgi:hypothetical protein
MAVDPNARKLTIGFKDGSLTAAKGTLTALFGPDLVQQAAEETIQVAVRSHQRFRVIGGDATSVSSSNYERKRYPQGGTSGAGGGEPIRLFVDGDWWTARLSGSHQAFNAFLKTSSWGSGENAIWKSEKGRSYGPFSSTAA